MGKRGPAFTLDEDDLIRFWVNKGKPVSKLAKMLGRGRTAVYARISRMKKNGTLGQGVFDLGHTDGDE
ncbi:MAG: hypothetical protein GQ535_11160 [Rhodobacteraceae bacterium]|nr:hypothetical protein [Paracoccaceae bacterium]